MSRRTCIEIDLADFDEADILAEAARISERRSSPLEHGPETSRDVLARVLSDLAASIAQGRNDEALRFLNDLAGDDRALRDAVDIGRRRR